MGVNSLPKTVTRQRRGCDFNPCPSAPESSTLTTRLYRATPVYLFIYYIIVHEVHIELLRVLIKEKNRKLSSKNRRNTFDVCDTIAL